MGVVRRRSSGTQDNVHFYVFVSGRYGQQRHLIGVNGLASLLKRSASNDDAIFDRCVRTDLTSRPWDLVRAAVLFRLLRYDAGPSPATGRKSQDSKVSNRTRRDAISSESTFIAGVAFCSNSKRPRACMMGLSGSNPGAIASVTAARRSSRASP